jgi:hypothetical protein
VLAAEHLKVRAHVNFPEIFLELVASLFVIVHVSPNDEGRIRTGIQARFQLRRHFLD